MPRPTDGARAAGERALQALDQALAARPRRDGDAFTAATDHLCRLRDGLVAARRAGAEVAVPLERVNAILSLVLAGHFPIGDTDWASVEQARAALRDCLSPGGD
jgi:hypothetical protein